MNNLNLISVVVPIYNKEKYLERCIKSIINQTYKNLEIILINDGSTDMSNSICKLYEAIDSRIVYIEQKNEGLSGARNTGIKYAHGKYITFVDADDWLNLAIYELCIDAFCKYKCDVVDYNCKYVYNDSSVLSDVYNKNGISLVEGNDILEDYLIKSQSEVAPFSVCKKIYKKELFNHIKFPVNRKNEDISTNFRILMITKVLVHLNCLGYYYYQNNNEDSLSLGKFRLSDEDLFWAAEELYSLTLETGNKKCIKLAELKRIRCYFSLLSKIAMYGYDPDIKCIENKIKEYRNGLKSNLTKFIFSAIPISRKILALMYIFNFKFSCFLLKKLRDRL